MAVNTVTAALAQVAGLPQGVASATVVQSPAGPTGDTTFVIDCRGAKAQGQLSLRGRSLLILNNGTAFSAISSINTSIDGTSYETLKTIQPATIGANTVEAAVAVPAVTTATITYATMGRDANYIKIITTGGDATSGFTVTIGN